MNTSLHFAKKNKNDEFYTQYSDIEKEVKYYKEDLKNKIVYCNCDTINSNFYKYFRNNFHQLQLKELIISNYSEGYDSFYTRYDGKTTTTNYLMGNGSFDSDECIELLKESDIIITNPPFSLMREYISLMLDYNKKFLIIATLNVTSYKEIFPLIQNNELFLGSYYGDMNFKVPDYYEPRKTRFWIDKNNQKWRSLGNVIWVQNIMNIKENDYIELTESYDENLHFKYDNYDAINVDKLKLIPKDHYGVMGVPITFLTKYNQNQFEIVKFRKGNDEKDLRVNGKDKFSRILIKRS